MSPKCPIKKKQAKNRTQQGKGKTSNKEIEGKFQTWLELRKLKNEHFDRELELSVESKLKLGYILFIAMLCFSSYSIYFNLTRERLEGKARVCARSSSEYINFSFEDVLIKSYPGPLLPSPWTLPNTN